MNAWFRRIVRRPAPRNAASSPSLRPVEPLKPSVGCTEYPPGAHRGSEGLPGAVSTVERAKSRFETWLRSRDPSDPAQAGAAAVWAELVALRTAHAQHSDTEGGRHA